MKLTSLSVSRYRTWLTCQLRYAFRYHDNLAEDDDVNTLHSGIGSLVHYCFEQAVIYRKHPRVFLKDAMGIFGGKLNGYNDQHAERIQIMLNSWSVIEPMTHGDEVHTELAFWMAADLNNQVINHGMIDLLVRRGNLFHIIDWKTVRPYRQGKDSDIKRDPQLCLYAIATSMLFDVPLSNVRSGMFFMENSRLVMADWIVDQAQSCLESMIGAGYNIINTDRPYAYPSPTSSNCKWCEFKSKCSYVVRK